MIANSSSVYYRNYACHCKGSGTVSKLVERCHLAAFVAKQTHPLCHKLLDENSGARLRMKMLLLMTTFAKSFACSVLLV